MNSTISPALIVGIIAIYFLILIGISYFTGKNADNQSFFIANRKSPWLLVAIGMIGASLSGVTFISVPGAVGAGGTNQAFSYMQMVLGYLVGYAVIAWLLMPLYYKWSLTTIYSFLGIRFGKYSHKIGSAYFLLSRIIGASLRLFLVAIVLQKFVMDSFGVPFFLTVFITIILIWLYTYRAGIKTIVITDTLQTISMLTALIFTIFSLSSALDFNGISGIFNGIRSSSLGQMFFFEEGWTDPNNFFKQFLSGALIATAMTGLDQDMMQKNLTCKNIKEAQWNIYVFSGILILANLMFLTMGALLYLYAQQQGIFIPERSDQLFPMIALQHLPPLIGIFFIIGLIAAAYSSADSALTSLTTSFCIDFLNFEQSELLERVKVRQRILVHIMFSIIIFLLILGVNAMNKEAVINNLFTFAGFTYGPIMGLFAFAILTKRHLKDQIVLIVCILAPILTYVIQSNSERWLGGFSFGSTILGLNAILTYIGLYLISYKAHGQDH